jgi:hypothetical protein
VEIVPLWPLILPRGGACALDTASHLSLYACRARLAVCTDPIRHAQVCRVCYPNDHPREHQRSVDASLPLAAQGCLLEFSLAQGIAVLGLCATVTMAGLWADETSGTEVQRCIDKMYRPVLTMYWIITIPIQKSISNY